MAGVSRGELRTSVDAESAFYTAFEGADIDAMMAVWASGETDDLMCIHPHGPRLIGYTQIRESWEQILTHSPPMRLEISERHVVAVDSLAIHYVNEHIHVGDDDGPRFTVMATNVYRRTEHGWRMILHHASPTPESLEQVSIDSSKTKKRQAEDIILH